MPQADVLNFIALLGGIEAETPQILNYYKDIATDLGHQGLFTEWQLVPAVKNQGVYATDPAIVELLGVFYDDEFLSQVTLKELEARSPQWRDTIGHPICYTEDQQDRNAFQLYPAPDADSDPQIFIHGAPFGLDYPRGTIAVIVSDVRVDYPTWIDLPFSLAIMALEFMRDSDHRNENFATVCMKLGSLLMAMVSGE